MVSEKEIDHDDFPDDDRIKKPNSVDEEFKKDFINLMHKYKVTDYICAVSFNTKSAFMTTCFTDVFLASHIEMCIQADNKSIERNKLQSIN